MSYLLDTNAIINYLDGSFPDSATRLLNSIVDDAPTTSVVSKMETLGFNFKSVEEQTIMETFINNSKILDLNNDIVNKTIELRKTNKIKLPDAIVAATAIVNDLILITRNTTDFKNIANLKIINPYKL